MPSAWLTAEDSRVSWASRDEPGLGQNLPGRGILVGGGRPERAQPISRRGQLAQLPDGRGRHAAAGDVLRDPVTQFRCAVLGEDQVESAQYRAILGDEHMEGAEAGLLLGQQGAVPLGELVEELIAPVGDRGSEVGAVRQLDGQLRFRRARPGPATSLRSALTPMRPASAQISLRTSANLQVNRSRPANFRDRDQSQAGS